MYKIINTEYAGIIYVMERVPTHKEKDLRRIMSK